MEMYTGSREGVSKDALLAAVTERDSNLDGQHLGDASEYWSKMAGWLGICPVMELELKPHFEYQHCPKKSKDSARRGCDEPCVHTWYARPETYVELMLPVRSLHRILACDPSRIDAGVIER